MDIDKSAVLQKQDEEIKSIYARVDAIGFDRKTLFDVSGVAKTTPIKAAKHGFKLREETLDSLRCSIDELELRYTLMVEYIDAIMELGITRRELKRHVDSTLKQKYVKKS